MGGEVGRWEGECEERLFLDIWWRFGWCTAFPSSGDLYSGREGGKCGWVGGRDRDLVKVMRSEK